MWVSNTDCFESDQLFKRAVCTDCFESERPTRVKRTQHERILHLMTVYQGKWICGTALLFCHMPTYSQRIGEMVEAGAPIERQVCDNPEHRHESGVGSYRFVIEPQGRLL